MNVYQGAGVVPSDIDGAGVEPLTSGSVAVDPQAAGAYVYSVSFVAPGEYTVAFTCRGLAEDPAAVDDLAFIGAQDVTGVADQDVTADF